VFTRIEIPTLRIRNNTRRDPESFHCHSERSEEFQEKLRERSLVKMNHDSKKTQLDEVRSVAI